MSETGLSLNVPSSFSGSPSSQHHSIEGTLSGLTVKDVDEVSSPMSYNQPLVAPPLLQLQHQLLTQQQLQQQQLQQQQQRRRGARPASTVVLPANKQIEAVQFQHIMPSTFSSPSGLINLAAG